MAKLLNFKDVDSPLKVRAKSKTSAEVVIYGTIGLDWGDSITAKQFHNAMKEIGPDVTDLSVRINSPGGDVFDGIAMYNILRQHKAKKTVFIDGWAASIASIIALAGDEIIMGEGALYMIHLPWTVAMGNRNEMDNVTSRLIDIEDQMIGIYAKRSGLGKSEIKKMMEDETWMDAEEAISYGFVHKKVEETALIAASAVKASKAWAKKIPDTLASGRTNLIKTEISALQTKISGILARSKT